LFNETIVPNKDMANVSNFQSNIDINENHLKRVQRGKLQQEKYPKGKPKGTLGRFKSPRVLE
jgi:hypothetical protein